MIQLVMRCLWVTPVPVAGALVRAPTRWHRFWHREADRERNAHLQMRWPLWTPSWSSWSLWFKYRASKQHARCRHPKIDQARGAHSRLQCHRALRGLCGSTLRRCDEISNSSLASQLGPEARRNSDRTRTRTGMRTRTGTRTREAADAGC